MTIARLTAVGGDSKYHYAHFLLEQGRTTIRILVEIEGPQPDHDRKSVYTKLLHHVGVLAQQAADTPGKLACPDRL